MDYKGTLADKQISLAELRIWGYILCFSDVGSEHVLWQKIRIYAQSLSWTQHETGPAIFG